jgi:excisionase family DNA binding protein
MAVSRSGMLGSIQEVRDMKKRCDADISGLRVAEVSKKWGVSEGMIRRLVRTGELPSHRIGRAVMILTDDIRSFLAERRRQRGHAS